MFDDDNKGKNFEDEKHCKTMSEVSIMKGSRKSKRALNFTGSKRNIKQSKTEKTNKKVDKLTEGWRQL